jgi:hypothetical protein
MKALATLRAALAAGMLLAAGCSLDIFDVEVHLDTQTWRADFGATPGSIPVVSCDPSDPVDCEVASPLLDRTLPGLTSALAVHTGCDAHTSLCYGEAEASVAMTFAVLQDDDVSTNLERRAVSFVKDVTLAYTVPVNSLTFSVPDITLHTGPAGSRSRMDHDVVPLGIFPALVAATPVMQEKLLKIDDDAALEAIGKAVSDRKPFSLIVSFNPRVDGGDPMPGGSIEIDVQPRLLIGIR